MQKRPFSAKLTPNNGNIHALRRFAPAQKCAKLVRMAVVNVGVVRVGVLLLASSGSIRHRGVAALTKVLGLNDAKKFLKEVRDLKDLDDIFK